ncbi:MAG: GNAT family N-acetyltransferase [Candidatus Pacebacteria bacterium]|nr:GNAT family N-acetyltransferase [Candidatus Paceibacterota bacterium]
MSDEIIFRRGPRVTLRPLHEDDAPILTKWINDPLITQFVQAYLPTMEMEERDWIKGLISRKGNNIVVMLVVDSKPIGTMGIHAIDYRHRIATTGALIGEPEYWGKGYGNEAKMLLLEYAFNTLNLRKICSEVIAFNERSTKYSLKCGYKVDGGPKKLHHYAKGQYWDVIQLAVFREDWLPIWEIFYEKHKDALVI